MKTRVLFSSIISWVLAVGMEEDFVKAW